MAGDTFTYSFDQRPHGDYRADLGFTQRRNTNREDFIISYDSEPKPDGNCVMGIAAHSAGMNFGLQGRTQSWNNTSRFLVNLQRQRDSDIQMAMNDFSKRSLTSWDISWVILNAPLRQSVNVTGVTTSSKQLGR